MVPSPLSFSTVRSGRISSLRLGSSRAPHPAFRLSRVHVSSVHSHLDCFRVAYLGPLSLLAGPPKSLPVFVSGSAFIFLQAFRCWLNNKKKSLAIRRPSFWWRPSDPRDHGSLDFCHCWQVPRNSFWSFLGFCSYLSPDSFESSSHSLATLRLSGREAGLSGSEISQSVFPHHL